MAKDLAVEPCGQEGIYLKERLETDLEPVRPQFLENKRPPPPDELLPAEHHVGVACIDILDNAGDCRPRFFQGFPRGVKQCRRKPAQADGPAPVRHKPYEDFTGPRAFAKKHVAQKTVSGSLAVNSKPCL